MHTVTGPVLTMFLGAVTAILVLAGGVIFLAFGKARGLLAGIGFIVLALGAVAGTVLAVIVPMVGDSSSATTAAVINSVIQIVLGLIGWGLVIAAMLRLRAERATPRPPVTGGPGWGHPASGTEGPPPPPGV